MESRNNDGFAQIALMGSPGARAVLRGSAGAPTLSGVVAFYPAGRGTLVVAEVMNLPSALMVGGKREGAGPFHGFHIHEGKVCGSGEGEMPFMDAGKHLNPDGAPHPRHMGDMPLLLGNNGYAYAAFYTERFTPDRVIGHTVVVHQNADDFRTQPSGNSGVMIGCGEIVEL